MISYLSPSTKFKTENLLQIDLELKKENWFHAKMNSSFLLLKDSKVEQKFPAVVESISKQTESVYILKLNIIHNVFRGVFNKLLN